MEKKLPLAITMGDPAGVGPELCWRSLTASILAKCQPVLVGSADILCEAQRQFAPQLDYKIISETEVNSFTHSPAQVLIIDATPLKYSDLQKGQVSAVSGAAALRSIALATDLCLNKTVVAMVTAPASKEAIELSGVPFTGHTEWISERCGDCDEMMMMSALAQNLHIGYVSTHVPIARLCEVITQDLVLRRLRQCAQFARELSLKSIAVCGLNPHAGENGHIGQDELERIIPAMLQAQSEGIYCVGPFPADTLFVPSIRNQYDIVLAMYHDQGGIPFKMLAFEEGVNHTLGLPIIRSSVDHGTAWDLAWKGRAHTGSMIAAIELALMRAKGKLEEMS